MIRRLLPLAVALPLLAACGSGTGAQVGSGSASSAPSTTSGAGGTTSGTSGSTDDAGQGDGGMSTQVTRRATIGLSYVPDIQFAPFYVAAEKGYFGKQNLTVTLRHHGANEQLFGALQSGTEDVLYAGGDELMQARSQGVKAKNVGTVYQDFPVVAIVRKDSGITSAAQLKGKTIGVPGRFGESWFGLLAILKEAGLTEKDVTIQQIGFTQQAALTTKKVDAVMGYANNDLVRLQNAGVEVTPFAVKGSLVSIGLNALDTTVETKSATLTGVVTALQQAVADIAADPAGAVQVSKKYVPTLTGPEQEKAARATLDATLKLIGDPQKVGSQNATTWDAMSTFMKDAGLVTTQVPAKEAYTTITG